MSEEKYSVLGYKRLILDYHFSEFNPDTLINANAREIADAMASLGIDSLLLYAKDHWGNIYHHTETGHMHRNVQFDLFGQVLSGLKEKGIRTIAYTTICWDEWAARHHPEWRLVRADGAPSKLSSDDPQDTHAKWTFLCMNTGYRDYVLGQIDELLAGYDFPALFLDILLYWPGATACYCSECRSKWRARYGYEIPAAFTPEDAARYIDFVTEMYRSFVLQVRNLVKARGRRVMLTHNFGLFYDTDDYVAMEMDAFGRDYFRSSWLAKLYRARAGGGEVELIGHRFNQSWDFTTKPIPLLKWDAATAVAHDCAVMYVDQPHFRGDLDPKAIAHMRKAFETIEELTPHVVGTEPYADIALLDCERSMTIQGEEALDQIGAHKLLTETHFAFDMIDSRRLTLDRLNRFKLVIVPFCQYLDAKARQAIQEYVRNGGRLLFCYRSGFADDMGRPLKEKAFGLVIPTEASAHVVDFLKPSFAVDDVRVKVKGFQHFRILDQAEILATYTPPNIDVTPTEWSSHEPSPGADTDLPGIVLAPCSEGEFVYIGARIFKEYLHQDLISIRQSVVHCIERLMQPTVSVQAPRVVEAIYASRGDTLKVFLINGITGKPCGQEGLPGVSGGLILHTNIDEVIPIHDIRVSVLSRTVREARDLSGKPLRVEGNTIHVPQLMQYDVVTVVTGS